MIEIKYFVHATTVDNMAKRATGWLQGELSEKGIAQAKSLAEVIKDEEFDVVISSDLKRAIDSAKINFSGRDVEMKTDFRIRECNYGDLDGKDSALVKYEEHIEEPFPNGESMKDVENRIRDFVAFLKENYDGKKVAIVAHKAPQLALNVVLNKMTWEDAIATDWRKTGAWQPGWKFVIE